VWEILWPVMIISAVVWMQVERDEVNTGPDIPLAHHRDKFATTDAELLQAEPYRVEMPCMIDAVAYYGRYDLTQPAETLVIDLGDATPCLAHAVALGELGETKGCSHIGHAVLESGLLDLVIPGALGT